MIKPLFAAIAFLFISGCGGEPQFSGTRFLAMGTWVSVTWQAEQADSSQNPDRMVEREFQRIGREYYPWTDGELSALNRALATGQRFQPSSELLELITVGQQFWRSSSGFFDPGVGRTMRAWGFGSEETFAPPSQEEITSVSSDSIGDIVIDGDGWISSELGTPLLDFGGFGKGYAVDRAIEILQGLGIRSALVDAGGDLRAVGARGDRPWRVAIRHPRRKRQTVAAFDLRSGEAAFTSGDYENRVLKDGRTAHHLMNPATGTPTDHTQSVTVIADSGVLADAAATAIFVAGPEQWRSIAKRLGVSLVFRIDAGGSFEMTDAMAQRIDRGPELAFRDIMSQRS